VLGSHPLHTETHVALHGKFLWSGMRHRPGQKLKRHSKFLACTWKKIIGWGCGFFV